MNEPCSDSILDNLYNANDRYNKLDRRARASLESVSIHTPALAPLLRLRIAYLLFLIFSHFLRAVCGDRNHSFLRLNVSTDSISFCHCYSRGSTAPLT